MMTSRRVGLFRRNASRQHGEDFTRRGGRKIDAYWGRSPSLRRVGSRVPPDPTSLRLLEMTSPFNAEVLCPRSGSLLKVVPPNGQRFFAEVMPLAASGSPIGLGSLPRSPAFRLRFGLMEVLPRFPDYDGAQCVRRHLFRSGFSWTWPRGAGFGCEVTSCSGCAILQISKCEYQALGIGEWAIGRSIKKLSNPGGPQGFGHNERGFFDLKQGLSHLRPGGSAFLDCAISVQPLVPAPKLLRQPSWGVDWANEARDVDEGVQVVGAQLAVHRILSA